MTERVGQQLGNYRLSRLLGKGGFAEVYLGEHVYLKTPAAIKLLQAKVANQQDLDGFLKEAQTIAQLVHPHIVRVLEFGLDGETPYLVMDYAAGGTLRQRHPRGMQLPLATILPYARQVAEALQFAHEEKFIHRDIKPENMLVGRREVVLLSDFGIALIAQSSRYQSTQDVIGTVAYMAPEQIQGKPRPASDQYSLGVVIYEWLTGDCPFHGSFTELCVQHLFAPPSPLREKLPGLAPAVEEVVMTALAKDPKGRFSSIQAFANALEQASQVKIDQGLPARDLLPSRGGERAIGQEKHLQESVHRLPELFIPIERITPASQTSLSTEEVIPLSKAPVSPMQMDLLSQPTPPISETIIPPGTAKRAISRRTVVIGLTGLATLAGGGLMWKVLSGPGTQSALVQPTDIHMGPVNFLQSTVTIAKGQSITLIDDAPSPHIIRNGSWSGNAFALEREAGAPTVVLNFNGHDSMVIGPFHSAGTFHFCCTVHLHANLLVIVQ